MTELKYNIKYPEYNFNYNFNYHIKKDLYYNRTIPLLSKCKKNSFENKCTQTKKTFENKCTQIKKTFENRTFSNDSISDYDSDKKKEKNYNKIKLKIKKINLPFKKNILVEDVDREIPDFITIGEKIMSLKDVEKCIFLDKDDERILCEMPEEYQEMKRVYINIMK